MLAVEKRTRRALAIRIMSDTFMEKTDREEHSPNNYASGLTVAPNGMISDSGVYAVSELCKKVKEIIVKRKVIRERTLLDFNKLSIWAICASLEELPSAFYELAEYISDYWRYQAASETDRELAYSYIRIYQSVNMLKTYYFEREREQMIREQSLKSYDVKKLLGEIRDYPGISRQKLQKKLGISFEKLDEQIAYLDINGFCTSKCFGFDKCYILSENGIDLYDTMMNRRIFSFDQDQLSSERAYALYKLLDLCLTLKINKISVKTLLHRLSKYSDADIPRLISELDRLKSEWDKKSSMSKRGKEECSDHTEKGEYPENNRLAYSIYDKVSMYNIQLKNIYSIEVELHET